MTAACASERLLHRPEQEQGREEQPNQSVSDQIVLSAKWPTLAVREQKGRGFAQPQRSEFSQLVKIAAVSVGRSRRFYSDSLPIFYRRLRS